MYLNVPKYFGVIPVIIAYKPFLLLPDLLFSSNTDDNSPRCSEISLKQDDIREELQEEEKHELNSWSHILSRLYFYESNNV